MHNWLIFQYLPCPRQVQESATWGLSFGTISPSWLAGSWRGTQEGR